MAVHWFGIRSLVWCRAKLFDLDQAAFRSGCPHCSFMYESFPIENLMTFETSIDKIQHAHPRSLCIGAVFVCVEVLRPSQPNGVMSSAVSLSNHTFTGQA